MSKSGTGGRGLGAGAAGLRSSPGSRSADPCRGFTLIELVVVIVVTGVIASVIGLFIAEPIRGYLDQARRAALVDAAQLALVRMGRDLRSALPNSTRVDGTGAAVEMLHVIDGDRYRAEAPGGDDDQLDTTAADTSFDTFLPLGAGQAFSSPYLAVYPQLGSSPYTTGASSVMTNDGVDISGTATVGGHTEYRVGMNAHQFPAHSPSRRVFLVEGPVTYYCSGGQLLRYSGYALSASQPVPPPGTPVLVTGNVESCLFTYQSGATQRRALAVLTLVLNADTERIRLVRQVHVDNTP
jgi:MSHA biogenesis protein MshO